MRIAGLYPQRVTPGPQGEPEFLEPLGLEYVLAQVADEHEVKLFTLFGKTPRQLTQELIDYKPEVLAVSAMTPQIKLGLKMNRAVKRALPNTISVFGGYHPTALPGGSLGPEVDFIIQGEGDNEFKKMAALNFNKKELPWSLYRGIKIQDLDSLKDPLRPEFLEQLRNYGTMYPPVSEQVGFTSVLFSRGCLFNCNFCASPGMHGKGVRYRSVQRVVDELKQLSTQRGLNTFLFCDLNFTSDKEKTKELCRGIIDSGTKVYWECLANIATSNDEEMLGLMHDAGCRKIGWGIESLNPQVIGDMGKVGMEKAREVLQKSEDAGILNTGFYIIGHPSETPQNILRYSGELKSLPLHRIRVTAYTPLPGSRLYRKTAHKSTDFNLYDTTHLVFRHPNLLQGDLDTLRAQITAGFYKSPEYLARAKGVVVKFPEYKEVFAQELKSHLNT